MIFAYLDEFGHIGPYYAKDHPQYNTSPVFGLAGILLPERAVRPFSAHFLHRKADLLGDDIAVSGKPAHAWEKKGTNLFTQKSISKYPNIKSAMFRILNGLRDNGGKIFYHGREKIYGTTDVNSIGLYKTILSNAIRRIDRYADSLGQNFVIVIDEHSSRRDLLETAAKTMFGTSPARRLASPPFEVESYLNQNIQAADWVATIVGRLWNYKLSKDEFIGYELYHKYFFDRIKMLETHSSVLERRPAGGGARPTSDTPKGRSHRDRHVGTLGEAIIEAQRAKGVN